jgi:hypothetical protein
MASPVISHYDDLVQLMADKVTSTLGPCMYDATYTTAVNDGVASLLATLAAIADPKRADH